MTINDKLIKVKHLIGGTIKEQIEMVNMLDWITDNEIRLQKQYTKAKKKLGVCFIEYAMAIYTLEQG